MKRKKLVKRKKLPTSKSGLNKERLRLRRELLFYKNQPDLVTLAQRNSDLEALCQDQQTIIEATLALRRFCYVGSRQILGTRELMADMFRCLNKIFKDLDGVL